MDHNPNFGWGKFRTVDAAYFEYIDKLVADPPPTRDLLYQFPLYVGHVNLGRYLFFYDLYKQVLELAGHIGELGVYKGASLLYWAKLVRLFEPYSTTQVHGFDWFQGMPSDQSYQGSYEDLVALIELQKLQDVAIVHRLDLIRESALFLANHPQLRFKLLFLDCGEKTVLEPSLLHFWPRLVRGGVLIMDHYNTELSPDESQLVDEVIGSNLVRQLPFNRQPTAYVIKER